VQTPSGETWARHLRLAGRPIGEAEALGERLSEPRPVLDLLGETSGLVLLGDPGSGKTTFLRLLALSLASGHRGTMGLQNRLPLPIPLSAYANALARRDVTLARFLPRYFEDRDLEPGLAVLFERKLAAGEVLLLLDGLDEVREVRLRNRVVQRVEDFYRRHREAGNKFVLTSRIVGYREVRPSAEGSGGGDPGGFRRRGDRGVRGPLSSPAKCGRGHRCPRTASLPSRGPCRGVCLEVFLGHLWDTHGTFSPNLCHHQATRG